MRQHLATWRNTIAARLIDADPIVADTAWTDLYGRVQTVGGWPTAIFMWDTVLDAAKEWSASRASFRHEHSGHIKWHPDY